MKHWTETQQLFEWIAALRAEQRSAALATVVRVRGSAYRREGAKMAIAADGASVGNVSGGCLEEDVREVALEVIASGAPQLRTYCSSADDIYAWDLGVGCEGEVQVYIEPATNPSLIEQERLRGAEHFAVCRQLSLDTNALSGQRIVITAATHDGTVGDASIDALVIESARAAFASNAQSSLVEMDGPLLFMEIFTPPPQLIILGAGNDARPLARLAVDAGFRVTVADRRPALLHVDRFPDRVRLVECQIVDLADRVALDRNSYAVVMTHNFADDEQYLRVLAQAPVPYIGMLGPRQRSERIVRHVSTDVPFNGDRVYGPIGLDVGTDGAEQVAVAILAEILAVRNGRRPESLRLRAFPIHIANDL